MVIESSFFELIKFITITAIEMIPVRTRIISRVLIIECEIAVVTDIPLTSEITKTYENMK